MDTKQDLETMLQRIHSPAFLTCDGIITAVNQGAQARFLSVGTAVASILVTGQEEFADFQNGNLFLQISVAGSAYDCTVTHLDQFLLFTIEEDTGIAQLQVLSLAAQQLSMPIAEISLLVEQIQELADSQKSQLNKNLFRLMRMIGNMSDTAQYASARPRLATCEVCAIFAETLEKAKALLAESNIPVVYRIPDQRVYTLANAELLKRAVYNLLSNAAKFSQAGETVEATLKRSGNKLYFTVVGGSCKITGDLFHRYNRQPALESRELGLGLGMALIRSAATAHSGAVLIEQPTGGKVKITMTLSIQDCKNADVRSPILIPDLYGGNDQALVELSDVLPHQLYNKEH